MIITHLYALYSKHTDDDGYEVMDYICARPGMDEIERVIDRLDIMEPVVYPAQVGRELEWEDDKEADKPENL